MSPRFFYPLSFQRCPSCKHRLKPSTVQDPVDGPIPVLACSNPECDYDIPYDVLYGQPRTSPDVPQPSGKTPALPIDQHPKPKP